MRYEQQRGKKVNDVRLYQLHYVVNILNKFDEY